MQILLLSGTPGTGKTTIAKILEQMYNFKSICLGNEIKEKHLYLDYDSERGSYIVDEQKLQKFIDENLAKFSKLQKVVIESHFSDMVLHQDLNCGIILRCHPNIIGTRLKDRSYSPRKILENKYAEFLGDCSSFMMNHPQLDSKTSVFEIDTSYRTPNEIADICNNLFENSEISLEFQFGQITWLSDPSIDLSEYESIN